MKKLVLLLILFCGTTLDVMSQWSQITNDTATFNSGVGNDVIRYKGYLWFSQGNNIRKFDGTNWSSGKGAVYPFNQYPYVLSVYKDTLYGGGRFTHTSNGKTYGLIKWNGLSWVPVLEIHSGGFIFALASYKNNLYIGGDFYSIANLQNIFVRKFLVTYNGDTCIEPYHLGIMCGSTPSKVMALKVLKNKLYVGGDFDSVAGLYSPKIFVLEDTIIRQTTGLLSCNGGITKDFTLYKDTVLACLSSYSTPYIKLNNYSCVPFGSTVPPSSSINTICAVGDSVYAGTVDGAPVAQSILGGTWTTVSAGLNNLGFESPTKLFFDSLYGKLYVVGEFQKSFGDVANGIAVFNQQFSIILPIELLNFNCRDVGNGVLLEWQTASEINNDYFEIQRSVDATTWETIGQVNGSGTATIIQIYNFLDNSPNSVNYYRLKQVDFDGKFSFSHICAVEVQRSNKLVIYPNPFVEEINFSRITSGILYDLWGREIEYLKNTNYINTNALSSGVYMYIDISGEKFKIIK